jgi:hypothetical protein
MHDADMCAVCNHLILLGGAISDLTFKVAVYIPQESTKKNTQKGFLSVYASTLICYQLVKQQAGETY